MLLWVMTLISDACANTGIPAVGFSFWMNVILFPVVVAVEGWFYRRKRVRTPFKLSLASNAASSLAGVLLSLPLSSFMVQTRASLKYYGAFAMRSDSRQTIAISVAAIFFLIAVNFG